MKKHKTHLPSKGWARFGGKYQEENDKRYKELEEELKKKKDKKLRTKGVK